MDALESQGAVQTLLQALRPLLAYKEAYRKIDVIDSAFIQEVDSKLSLIMNSFPRGDFLAS